MEHTLAEKRRNLLRYTPKPHSRAPNDVIMHKTHCWDAGYSSFEIVGGTRDFNDKWPHDNLTSRVRDKDSESGGKAGWSQN